MQSIHAITRTLIVAVALLFGSFLGGDTDNMRPLFNGGVGGVIAVLVAVPFLFVGFDVIPQSAEEINLPPARIGLLLVISVALAVLWYGLISFSVSLSMPREDIAASSMATGDAATALWGHPSAGALLVLGGVAGILTSWNAFVIGASRLLFALAESGMVPAVFGRLHPRFNTPYVGIIAIGALSCAAPLFGRTVLVWLINAGGFATIVAYFFVPVAFLVLRRNEPEMARPFRVSHPRLVGIGAIGLALGLISAYLPGSPSALVWPYEWVTILVWTVLGVLLYLRFRGGSAS